MTPRLPLIAAALGAMSSCARPSPAPPQPATTPAAPSVSPAPSPVPSPQAAPPAAPEPDAAPAQLDPDGNDDPEAPGTGELPRSARFERVGRSRLSLKQVCDLTPFGDALYAAHAYQPLGLDGATITRYVPGDDPAKAINVAFDWNRPGEKQTGGGAGQGFLRVRAIGGRLFVPDADPPYNGLGLSEFGTEGYVFVSDHEGTFARARMPGHLPPLAPTPDGKAGAAVLPRAYHVIDTIRYRGRYYASTGSVPPKQPAWSGPSPGALHVASADLSRWNYEVDYPYPWKDGVWRLTFMVRFRDRLYAGIQDYDGREPNDYVVFEPPADATELTRAHARAVRVTSGTAQTIRWYADAGRLYWIASSAEGVVLRVTDDGDHWAAIDLPADAGRPTDLVRWRGSLVLLTERGLWKLGDKVERIAEVTDKKSPFALLDIFCAAPLAVYRDELYAGGQRDGSLYKLVE